MCVLKSIMNVSSFYFFAKLQSKFLNKFFWEKNFLSIIVKDMDNQIWYIIFSVVLLLVFGIIRWLFREPLLRTLNGFLSSYQASRDFKGGTIVYSQYNILASGLYFLSLGFMLYKVNGFFKAITLWGDFTTFIIIVITLIVFTYLKILLYLFLGFVIDGYQITREFIYNWVIINHISGIVFLPVAIILAFADIKFFPYFMWAGLSLLILFNIYRLIRGFKIIFPKKFPVYYILLYLCTLEFLPVVALWHFIGR